MTKLEELERDVDQLRRSGRNRFLGLAACNAVLAVGVCAVALRPPASVPPASPPILSAYGFALLDTGGKTRGTFATNREGQPELKMVGNEGTLVTLGFSRSVSDFPLLSFGDGGAKYSVLLTTNKSGPELRLNDGPVDADPVAHSTLTGRSLFMQAEPNGAYVQSGVHAKGRAYPSSSYLEIYDGTGNEQFCATPKVHPANR